MRKRETFDLQRKAVANKTMESWKQIPHSTFIYEPDITEFLEAYKIFAEKKKLEGERYTLNTILLWMIVQALKEAPKLNAYLSYNHYTARGTLHQREQINLSIPWLLEDGKMVTFTVRGAEKMSLKKLNVAIKRINRKLKQTNIEEILYQAAIRDTKQRLQKGDLRMLSRIVGSFMGQEGVKGLQGRAKEEYYRISEKQRLTERDLVGGTVTISNLGSIYKDLRGKVALLEIIPPQVFAIGISAIQDGVGIGKDEDGEMKLEERKTLPICLAFDHRVLDFADVIPFIKKMDEQFERFEFLKESQVIPFIK